MFRITTDTAVADKWGPGKPGFGDGNPAAGTPSTQLNADWFDYVQEEISNVIEMFGGTLDPARRDQLYQAINDRIVDAAGGDYVARTGDQMSGNLRIVRTDDAGGLLGLGGGGGVVSGDAGGAITVAAGGANGTLFGVLGNGPNGRLYTDAESFSIANSAGAGTLGLGSGGAYLSGLPNSQVTFGNAGRVCGFDPTGAWFTNVAYHSFNGPAGGGDVSLQFRGLGAITQQASGNFTIGLSPYAITLANDGQIHSNHNTLNIYPGPGFGAALNLGDGSSIYSTFLGINNTSLTLNVAGPIACLTTQLQILPDRAQANLGIGNQSSIQTDTAANMHFYSPASYFHHAAIYVNVFTPEGQVGHVNLGHIAGNLNMGAYIEGDQDGSITMWGRDALARVYVCAVQMPAQMFFVNTPAATGPFSVFSNPIDARVVDVIEPYTKGLAEVLALEPISYRYKPAAGYDTDTVYQGLAPADIRAAMPEMVKATSASVFPSADLPGLLGEDVEQMLAQDPLLSLDAGPLPYALVNAIKELNAKVDAQAATIAALQNARPAPTQNPRPAPPPTQRPRA
jgi:hypothetical protein